MRLLGQHSVFGGPEEWRNQGAFWEKVKNTALGWQEFRSQHFKPTAAVS